MRVFLMLGCLFALLMLVSGSSLSTAAAAAEQPLLAMMEVGAKTTINMAAAQPLRGVAELLVEARNTLSRFDLPSNLIHHHVSVERHDHIVPLRFVPLPPKPVQHVKATLVPRLTQPTIHDSQKWGTKHPLRAGAKFVDAAIVGEDGKPYIPRKSTGIEEEAGESARSPFAKFVFPNAIAASADMENKDSNINLTPSEFKRVNRLQKQLKSLLDRLGSNIVFDHTKVKNRRYVKEFNAIKAEARALMEEYELRTGVKTIAWTLTEPNESGLVEPKPVIEDIYLSKQKDVASRPLQRKSDAFKVAPAPPVAGLATAGAAAGAAGAKAKAVKPDPRVTQRVSVSLARTQSGRLKANVKVNLVRSAAKVPLKTPEGSEYKNLLARPKAPLTISVEGQQGEKLVPGRVWEIKDPAILAAKLDQEANTQNVPTEEKRTI